MMARVADGTVDIADAWRRYGSLSSQILFIVGIEETRRG